MAFPTIADADTTSGTVTSNSSSWTLTYPTNIAAGDLLIAMIAADGISGYADWGAMSGAGSWWYSFGSLAMRQSSANAISVLYKKADSALSGTFDIPLAASEQGSWSVYRIPAGTWYGGETQAGFVSLSSGPQNATNVAVSGSTSTSTTPDPPSLDPANWDAEDTLWLAVTSVDASRTVSAYPSSPDTFTNTGYLASGGNSGATLGWARLEKNAASVDPGTFTISSSDEWVAATIAIRPAAPPPVTDSAVLNRIKVVRSQAIRASVY